MSADRHKAPLMLLMKILTLTALKPPYLQQWELHCLVRFFLYPPFNIRIHSRVVMQPLFSSVRVCARALH